MVVVEAPIVVEECSSFEGGAVNMLRFMVATLRWYGE
jgi:hypothetical protein